jgi:hypothetical protein
MLIKINHQIMLLMEIGFDGNRLEIYRGQDEKNS